MTDLRIFILTSTVAIVSKDPFTLLTPAVIYAFLIGFAMRIGAQWAKNEVTVKSTIIQVIYGVFLLYLGIFIWVDYSIGINIVYYAAACGAFSVVVINATIKWVELGVSGTIKHYIGKVLVLKDNDK